jgi:hypothetical protein
MINPERSMTMTNVTPSSGSVYADLGLSDPGHGEVYRDGENTYVWDATLRTWVQTKYAEDQTTDQS